MFTFAPERARVAFLRRSEADGVPLISAGTGGYGGHPATLTWPILFEDCQTAG